MRYLLTAIVTAIVCFAVMAGVGLARSTKTLYKLQPGDVALVPHGNLFCTALSSTSAICSNGVEKGNIAVLFNPHRATVYRLRSTSVTDATRLFSTAR
jgi:hypothetical protein